MADIPVNHGKQGNSLAPSPKTRRDDRGCRAAVGLCGIEEVQTQRRRVTQETKGVSGPELGSQSVALVGPALGFQAEWARCFRVMATPPCLRARETRLRGGAPNEVQGEGEAASTSLARWRTMNAGSPPLDAYGLGPRPTPPGSGWGSRRFRLESRHPRRVGRDRYGAVELPSPHVESTREIAWRAPVSLNARSTSS